MIRSYAEQVEVKGQVGSAKKNAWLGANDIANEGDWWWVTGTESADGRTPVADGYLMGE